LGDDELLRIAKKNGVSPATVLISYQVNRGIVVLPKSVTAQRTYPSFCKTDDR
jgi:glycerol 2-dehydrogenase (NADP+)